jgi:DMSO reductase family type II enzyme chaperone
MPTIENNPASGELDFYRLFAYCFGLPSAERFAWLTSREYRALLDSLGMNLDCSRKSGRVDRFADYQGYEAAYLAIFEVGAPAPPVPLLDSAYSRNEPAQQVVLDCVNFYDVLGLRSLDAVFPSDHLVTQLEFLAAVRYLRTASPSAEQETQLRHLERDFVERHLLTWLPVAQKKLEKLNPPVFPVLLRMLHSYLRKEFARLGAPEVS